MRLLQHTAKQQCAHFSTSVSQRRVQRPHRDTYRSRLHKGFWCPPRLRDRDAGIIEEANDWYFAMLHDSQRNDYFWKSLGARVEGKHVLDVGAGCGLLSLMAAKLGASKVTAIEASKDMAGLARHNAKCNGFGDRIRVVHGHSSDVSLDEGDLADVVVSETLGTLLLGEGAVATLADACRRLARRDAQVVPGRGAQFATLVSSPSLASLSSAPLPESACGFDLSSTNCLQDTASIYFTKDRGVRLNSLPDLEDMSERVLVASVEFGSTEPQDIPQSTSFEVRASRAGVVHAVVTSWEVWDDDAGSAAPIRLSTHLADTRGVPWGLHRDMQWGQGIQLVEDHDAAPRRRAGTGRQLLLPQPFVVEEGERLLLMVRWSEPDRTALQFRLRRLGGED
mmetsp:Transcript_55644/g.180595  ORF Transcript_55644/g.180595 Transcript_55644/m.180595 type:complete len:394 (-) Transcript_55644:325-1506(-)